MFTSLCLSSGFFEVVCCPPPHAAPERTHARWTACEPLEFEEGAAPALCSAHAIVEWLADRYKDALDKRDVRMLLARFVMVDALAVMLVVYLLLLFSLMRVKRTMLVILVMESYLMK